MFRDTIVMPQMPHRLVPDVFNSVDMIALIGKQFREVDPVMVEL